MSNLVNHSVTNLINGVSQQATSVRLDNQLEEQINCFSDVTKGLTIRNGLELLNVVEQDLSNRFKIEFNIDGQKYLVALDPDNVTPLVHIPLSADVDALTASINFPDYFKNVQSGDIKVIEDKDKVYILNKKKIVGISTLKSTFYDVKITNDRTLKTDTEWSTGDYTLTIESIPDPDTGAAASETPVDIVVDSTMSVYDIAAAFNATSMVNETGEVQVVGNKGSYRLLFEEIPLNFIAPEITIAESTTIQNEFTEIVKEPTSGFVGAGEGSFLFQADGQVIIYWDGVEISNYYGARQDVYQIGGYTYYIGNVLGVDDLTGIGGSIITSYSIRRESENTVTDDYTVSISEPNVSVGADFSIDKFADEGMIWVTGVSSNQTYDVTIEYEDAAGTPQTPVTLSTISVGTTTSNIKLNWVADQIRSQIDASSHFSCGTSDIYNNAIHFYSTTPYAYRITAIKVDNNFDTTSISSAIRATINNESGIVDTSTLPAVFAQGFKIRIGNESTEGSNYYLRYDGEFQGWKECGLDESRVIDPETMPYIIDKEAVRRTNEIVIEPAEWTPSNSGDVDSNPDPSFIERTINDIFFYGSRLGLATDDSLVMSKIDNTGTFFRTTTSQTNTADRVDIKLDSAKIGYDAIASVVTYDGKLLVNTGSTQSVLLVNTSFDLTSARLSEVSSYTLGTKKPLSVNNGLYFALSNNGKTNIFNYVTAGNNTYEAFDITKHVPTYIDGNIRKMEYANNFTVVGVEEDKTVLYVQNRFSNGQEVLQNAWHKWNLPYEVEHFYFDDNNLYLLLTAEDTSNVVHTFICKYDLTPQIVEESEGDAYIGWTPFLDIYTKDKTLIEDFDGFIGINDLYGTVYENVSDAYDSTEVTQIDVGTVSGPFYSSTSAVYYWEVDGNTNRIVWDDGSEILVGNNTLQEFDLGGYRYFKGDETEDEGFFEVSRAPITENTFYKDDIVYGIPYTASIELSEIIPRIQGPEGYTVMNYATLMLRRMRLYLGNSGVFTVNVDFTDRRDYTMTYTGQPLGKILLGRNSVSNINFKFPINGKSDRVKITISTDSSTPFNLLSAEWQGKMTVKGRNI